MIDTSTPKGRIIDAAMQLAKDRPWRDIALIDIAEAAGLSLADLNKDRIRSKACVLRAFSKAIDDEVLRKAGKRPVGQTPRDALFEVLMQRLDALEPYKTALRAIVASPEPDPSLMKTVLASQHWMLQAAGIDTSGARGAVRTLGLASVYASVVRTWLDDEDPGLARTMAALDRRLRRGEQNMQALEGVCGLACRVGGIFMPGRRRAPRDMPPRSAAETTPPPPAYPAAGEEPSPSI